MAARHAPLMVWVAWRSVGAVTDPDLPVSATDVAAAAQRIRGAIAQTPTLRSATLSAITGADVVVKFENLQFTASFKERGACNRLSLLSAEERARGVLAVSAGNHGLAVAYHAHQMGIGCTVVMPAPTPWAKTGPIEGFGATVVLEGETFDDALEHAHRLREESGAVMIPPFEDRAVIAGQGTLALEILDAVPEVEILVVPVGGGGLIAGVAVAAKDRRPDLEIVGVQSDRFPGLVRGARLPAVESRGATIAEGIAVKHPGSLTGAIIDALVDDIVAVPEARIEEAISLYLEIEKVVAEGAGAAALAALLHEPARYRGKTVAVVLSGGNIDMHVLAQVLMRSLARSGRVTHLTIELPDRPGALATVASVVAAQGANIVSVTHDRYRPELALKVASLEMMIETRDTAHRDAVVRALVEAGFPPVAVV
jgi:threonine dehydratase